MCVAQYWVRFHVDKGYDGKEDEVILQNRPKNSIAIRLIHVKMEDMRRSGRPANTSSQHLIQ